MLRLDEVRKILNKENLDEVMRGNLIKYKADTIETIDEQRNEREKQNKLKKILANRSTDVTRGKEIRKKRVNMDKPLREYVELGIFKGNHF